MAKKDVLCCLSNQSIKSDVTCVCVAQVTVKQANSHDYFINYYCGSFAVIAAPENIKLITQALERTA